MSYTVGQKIRATYWIGFTWTKSIEMTVAEEVD